MKGWVCTCGGGGVVWQATHLQPELPELGLYPGEGRVAGVLLPLLPQGDVVLLGRPGEVLEVARPRGAGGQVKVVEVEEEASTAPPTSPPSSGR